MQIQLLNKLRLKEKRMYSIRIEKSVQKALAKINEPNYFKLKGQYLDLQKTLDPMAIKN